MERTPYHIGRQFEYRVKYDLMKRGFFVVRSPQSRSKVDLTAISKETVLLVQCKKAGYCGVKEWNELIDLTETYGGLPILAEGKKNKPIKYWLMLEKKDGKGGRQPMKPFYFHQYPLPLFQE